MIIAGPDSSPLTPRKWEQHQTLVLANSCDIGSLSCGFLNWPRSSGTGPLSSSQTLPYWKATGTVGFSDTGARSPYQTLR